METLLRGLANGVAYSAIVPIALFIYFYGTKPAKNHRWLRRFSTLWTTTQVGKTLMLQMIAWFIYLMFVSISLFFHDFFGRDVLRLLIYVALVGLFWAFFFALRRLQKQKRIEHNQLGVNLDTDTHQVHNPQKGKQ